MTERDYDVRITTGASSETIHVPEDGPDDDAGEVMYVVGPVDGARGDCEGCGCRLQNPGPYDGTTGSIWLTPWMKWRETNRCTVCAAYDEDADAQAELYHWLRINAPYEPGENAA